ncbi:AraC family transcriptional regulator [Bacteroidales bacterium]|nr:AraC family transcriptional regulator [Bacteroidales bacterium]
MTNQNKHIPTYGLENFRNKNSSGALFQVEVFDANRHFEVQYPHRHNFYEVLYLYHGSGNHIIDTREYKIHPPCVFFMSPGQTHKLTLSNDIQGYIFLFNAEFYMLNQTNKNRLLEFPFFFSLNNESPPLTINNKSDKQFLNQLFERATYTCSDKNIINEEVVRSILDVILLTCHNLYASNDSFGDFSKSHILVKNFMVLLDENYNKNLQISEYAEMLNVTPNHLTHVVKQETGKTSIELLQEKLTLETKRLLLHTDMTIAEIASQMNFSDTSYFTKYFKKTVGKTPNQYRNNK